MGLDQYLSAKRHLSKYNNQEDKLRKKVRKLFPDIKDTGNLDFVEIKFEAGYWRKANHIHNWFVENVQDEQDDCGHYEVSRDDLICLLEVCKRLLKTYITNKTEANQLAQKELPTRAGFFFGGTEYDEFYWKDVEHTIKVIEYCLSLPAEYVFEYHSSW